VLLDLKLPYVNGFEVLAWAATQPSCKDLRIIILTSSGEEIDRGKAKQFGIGSYFLKPPTNELVAAVVKALPQLSQNRAVEVERLDPKSLNVKPSTKST